MLKPRECDVCGRSSHRRLFSLRYRMHTAPFQLWRCGHCGLVFNWPRLPEPAIRSQYDANYYIFSLPPARRWGRATQLYASYLLPLEHLPSRRLLEVGCARGDLLAIARQRGWDIQGVELAREAADLARQEHGLAVRTGTVEEHASDLKDFDVVIATDVVEHVPTPRAFVTTLRTTLRPRGRCILDTPNWGSFWRHVSGRCWLGINPYHIYLFDARSLTYLMRSCGWHSCRATSVTHTAYCAWGQRPELSPVFAALPAGLRWRAQRALNGLTPRSLGRELLHNPPTCLADAMREIERIAGTSQPRDGSFYRTPRRTLGDNLCVTAVAGDTSTSPA